MASKRFHVVIDGFLSAETIDDAFVLIASHFLKLATGDEDAGSVFEPDSHLHIEPYGDTARYNLIIAPDSAPEDNT